MKNMNLNIKDYFITPNKGNNITDKDYEKLGFLINTVKAFARSTYQCVYIIDHMKGKFLYASDNFYDLCGTPSSNIENLAYKFYTDIVPEKEQDMLIELSRSRFNLFETLPNNERINYTIYSDFHIIQEKKTKLINHKLTPLVLTLDNQIWLSLCTISISARKEPGYIIMKKDGKSQYYEYSLENHKWTKKRSITLSETERDVLRLSRQGYTMSEISETIFKSIDTIKSCKRGLFTKLGVKNIVEAISFAVNYRLL